MQINHNKLLDEYSFKKNYNFKMLFRYTQVLRVEINTLFMYQVIFFSV